MAITAIDARRLSQMLVLVADEIARREAELNALDAAVSDGNHGITMRIGFEAIRERLGQLDPAAPIDGILRESGSAFHRYSAEAHSKLGEGRYELMQTTRRKRPLLRQSQDSSLLSKRTDNSLEYGQKSRV